MVPLPLPLPVSPVAVLPAPPDARELPGVVGWPAVGPVPDVEPVLGVLLLGAPEAPPPPPPDWATTRPVPQARAAAAERARILKACLMRISC